MAIKKYSPLTILFLILVSSLVLLFLINKDKITPNTQFIKRLVEKNNYDFKDLKLIFYIRMTDFSCASCFYDFLTLSDSLNKGYTKKEIIYIYEKNNIKTLTNKFRYVRDWQNSLYIKYTFLIENNFNKNANLKRSCALIKMGDKVKAFYFPITNYQISEILNYLRNNKYNN